MFVCAALVFNTALLTVIILDKNKEAARPVLRRNTRPSPIPDTPDIIEMVEVGQTFPVVRSVKDRGAEARAKEAELRKAEMLREFPELNE